MTKKIIVFALVLSVFIFPSLVLATSTTSNSTSNYSEEELVALIAKLQKQLEEIRNNKIDCALANVDLSIGDGEGDNLKEYVKSLQNFLKEKGYFTYTATGYFGKITRGALLNFQKDVGAQQTGELNSSLREKIKTLKCRVKYYKAEIKDEPLNMGGVKAITLSGSGASVTWTFAGYSKNGFKIVWSKNSNPTYPTRDGDKYIYLSEPTATSTTLDAFSGSGTYYVRVCEYLGGSCGVYSNQIQVSL